VDEFINVVCLEVALEKLEVLYEFFIRRYFEALYKLLLQELKNYALLVG
jgi:hypothetical protein